MPFYFLLILQFAIIYNSDLGAKAREIRCRFDVIYRCHGKKGWGCIENLRVSAAFPHRRQLTAVEGKGTRGRAEGETEN